ncbi:hypothetical protein SAMN05443247_06533 [Bradyrhizobium erythrophlei]|nr:hypothetical protein SAMN05443247_06533 [Bradyrhizobium erythrophlei]
MPKSALISLLAWISLMAPALAQQIGPEIRVGPGEVSVGGAGIKDGKVVTPTPDQILKTVIDSNPATMFLSDADKQNVKSAIITTGYVSALVSDPVAGLVLISVLSKNGEKRDVPIPTVAAPPTGKTWVLTAKCIVQQTGNLITALFDNDPDHIAEVGFGDTMNVTAAVCPEYKQRSVTSVRMKVTGKNHVEDAKPPMYRHYFVGSPT